MPVHDDDLPAALAADLDGHFERLVLAYQQRLYAFALRLTSQPRDAEEIAQDAFVSAYRALALYPAERVRDLALRPWLYQITLNAARNRARVRRPATTPLDEEGMYTEPAAAAEQQPESRAESAERAGELAALVAELPERYRVAVLLHHVACLGYGEAALILGHPVGTVKSDVHRGIRLLRDALSRATSDVR